MRKIVLFLVNDFSSANARSHMYDLIFMQKSVPPYTKNLSVLRQKGSIKYLSPTVLTVFDNFLFRISYRGIIVNDYHYLSPLKCPLSNSLSVSRQSHITPSPEEWFPRHCSPPMPPTGCRFLA